jgi:hypothetical protein
MGARVTGCTHPTPAAGHHDQGRRVHRFELWGVRGRLRRVLDAVTEGSTPPGRLDCQSNRLQSTTKANKKGPHSGQG